MMDALDRKLILATQEGLPLAPDPLGALAEELDTTRAEIVARWRQMAESGVLRRVAVVPNHYKLGWTANGMSVWDIPDDRIDGIGRQVGALEFVSHCYHRPRRPPHWNYNLFAMVHGRNRQEVEEKVDAIAMLIGPGCWGYDVLYSRRILKKTGLRLSTWSSQTGEDRDVSTDKFSTHPQR